MHNFDKLALEWDDDAQKIERARKVADEIIRSIPQVKNKSGFEYGCGTGLLSFNLQTYLNSIKLADSSDGMLSVLNEKIKYRNILNMEYMKVDLSKENLIKDKFDIIYTLMVMHHILDVEKVIREFYDLLNTSGYICIADLEEEDGSFHGKDFEGHNGFNRTELSRMLENIGFCNVKSKICYEMIKKSESGEEKAYPVFTMIAEKK